MSRRNINKLRRSLLTLLCGLPAFLVREAYAKSAATVSSVLASGKLLAPGDFNQAINETLKGQPWQPSDAIKLEVPQIAENGAIVPITVESILPNTRRVLIFAEKNPSPLLAEFNLKAGSDAWVSLRVKLNDSGSVLAIAETSDRFYGAQTSVKVMVGGCG